MEFYEEFELEDCPECGGTGLLEEECGNSFIVYCMDCGGHTVSVPFTNEKEKRAAAKRVADLWNYGKFISAQRGE